MSQFQHIEVTSEELALSANTLLPENLRTEIIQRWKSGQTVSQIQDIMQLKRNNVRKVIDPDYYKPNDKRTRPSIKQVQEKIVEEVLQQTKAKDPDEKKSYTQRQLGLLSEEAKKFDDDATAADCIADLRGVQSSNPYSYINRNVYRHLGRYSDATWNRYFGTFLEFRRQAGLELTRQQHGHERNIARHASLDHYRQYYQKEIEKIHMIYPRCPKKGVNTIAVTSDNHDKMQDPFVWRVYKEVVKDFQPDVQLFNGDQADCYEFSKYTIDPRLADAVGALTYVRDNIFKEAREIAPDSEIVWNLGNHEMRLQKHLADASPYMRSVLGDFHGWSWADLFGVRELNINVNCKWDLAAFNKHDILEEVKSNYIVFWETFVAMHTHNDKFGLSGTSGHMHSKGGIITGANLSGGKRCPINWTVTPPTARGNAEYESGLDKSSQGFALFHIMPEKRIVVPELVLIQGDFAAVGGKYYYRRPEEVYLPTQSSWI